MNIFKRSSCENERKTWKSIFPALFMILFASFFMTVTAQQQNITGTVTDASGEPLPGVSVLVKGTTVGTATDIDGKFQLSVPNRNAIVEISYMGFITQSVTIGNQTRLNIQLKEDTQALEEIVVVGYSTQRRESLTGSLQSLKSDKIVTSTTPTVENMLSGKVPGVYVAPGGGQPGTRGSVIIRGKTSINGTVNPLWVIDGVIVGTESDLSLNPNDIETMTILKDAASTAIYGSRGANGVIVVTTKTAALDKYTLNVSAKYGVNSLSNGKMQVMSGSELYDYFKTFSNQEAIKFPRWNEDLRNSNFNWWDLATQTGTAQDYNVSLSGGNAKMKSYFSLGYYDEEGAVKGYEFEQFSVRYRAEYKPLTWLTVKPMIAASRRDVDNRQHSVTAMYANLPWDSAYMPDGSLTPHRSSTWVNSATGTNYLYDLQWNYSKNQRHSLMANLDFDIRLTDYLTFSSVNSLNWSDYDYHRYQDPRSNDAMGVKGRIQDTNEKAEIRYTNHILRFNRSLGKHSVGALVSYEFNDYVFKSYEAIGTGIVPGMDVLDATAKPEKTAGKKRGWAVQSYIFKANYAYNNKYLAEFSARRDGASNFGDNAKYGNFFSLSGGWNINREEFFKADWVNQLKLRASYGTVGTRPSDYYPQYDLYSVSNTYSYNGNSGVSIWQIGNKDLTWEKTNTFGVGLDFGFLERFRVSLDYYDKYTSNILLKVPVSGLSGVTSIWQNVGEMDNKGFEAVIGADVIKSKDWNWSIDFNIGLNRNRIEKLYGEMDKTGIITGLGNIAGSINRILRVGENSDSYYTREWAGVDPADGTPQWYKTDDSGARVITKNYSEANEVIVGNNNPDFFGGFSTNLSWKQIDLSAVFGYSSGGKLYNYARQEYDSDGTYTDRNQMKLISGWSRWEKPGDIATHPKPSQGNQSKANNVSSRYLEDAGYLKLRSLTLGYNLNLSKWKIQNLRISLTAENLFTITNYSGVDPEIPVYTDSNNISSVTGVSTASTYPITRKFMLGINFTL